MACPERTVEKREDMVYRPRHIIGSETEFSVGLAETILLK